MTLVTIHVEDVGDNFGHRGVVRSAKSGRVLATTRTFPNGFASQAMVAAGALASAHNYWIKSDNDEP